MGQAGIDHALWAFGRGSGITALVLLTVAIASGIVARSGRAVLLLPRAGMAVFHRGAALTATVLVALHVLSLLVDPHAQLRLVDLVVPFGGTYRPQWVGFGTVAVDLLAAVVISGLLRHRIGPRVFRVVHWATYVLWPIAAVHAVGAGTDGRRLWLLAALAGCAVVLMCAVSWRAGKHFTEYRQPETSAAGYRLSVPAFELPGVTAEPARPLGAGQYLSRTQVNQRVERKVWE
ncbi:ferric reductase-like transmembrane domain-containing protein [Nocardia sp. NPDC088792]|uniref:ferric reductase-like transmembrane domain-containing protein n=1 Tax=Nocardia sp. NPDC088792 TaxID=3364332 RepID=UPI00381E5105